MDDWIDDLGAKFRSESAWSERRAEESELIRSESLRFWGGFVAAVKDQIGRVNANADIQNVVRGEIRLTNESGSSFKLDKLTWPSVYITVTLLDDSLRIERLTHELLNPETLIRDNEPRVRPIKEQEQLQMILGGEGELLFKNKDQQLLTKDQVPQYVIKPMLIPYTVISTRRF